MDPLLNNKSYELRQEDILFDAGGVVVVNKPPGVASQATRKQSVFHMLALVEKHYKALGQKANWQLTHRLDKETSGAMIFARGSKPMQWIADQFRQRTVEKTYHALVWGTDLPESFEVSCRLSSIQPGSGEVKVLNSGGKDSYTRFRVLESYPNHGVSLVECYPKTGRSHQLRVHLASKGWLIVGDKVYSVGLTTPSELVMSLVEHQMLHALSISFDLEPEQRIQVKAAYPATMGKLIEALSTSRP